VNDALLTYFFLTITETDLSKIKETATNEVRGILSGFQIQGNNPFTLIDLQMIFDYTNEAYLMICTFESYRDFRKVAPFEFGFTEEYIRSIELEEEETEKVVHMLWDFHNELADEPSDFS
jgi:hypothetical protein